jgi:alpha/beta superfamily hydrolase
MRKIPTARNLLVDGPSGRLEALLEVPADDEVTAVAVVCHPHPVYGGTMHNKVVHTLARAFLSNGIAALRFNFRGVGESDGDFDEGDGELLDTMAAVTWLTAQYARLPVWLAGFSFGGAIAVRASLQVDAAGLVSIAPAIRRFATSLTAWPQCPWLIVQGDADELVDVDETVVFVDSLDPGPELAIFEGGEHFFHGRLVELRATVEDFIGRNRRG